MQDKTFELVTQDHYFRSEGRQHRYVPVGATVEELVRLSGIPEKFYPDLQVVISKGVEATPVPLCHWGRVRPGENAHVHIYPTVNGPALGLILSAILPGIASTLAGTLFAAGTLGFKIAVAAFTIIGTLAINALIPPPSVPEAAKQDDPNFTITGSSNAENRYGIYPVVLGRHQMFPPKTARGYTEGEADDIHFRGRFTFGYGPVSLETLKIGTTPITDFEDVEIEFLNVHQAQTLAHLPDLAPLVTAWRFGSEALSLYPDDIAEDGYSVLLAQDSVVVRATRERAISVSVDVTYQGLVKFDGENRKQNRSVEVKYRYRKVGDQDWLEAGTDTHTGKSTAQLRFTKTIQLPEEGEYDIEVTRLSEDSDDSTVRDDAFLSAIRSVQAGALPSHDDIAEIAVRIKASDQLNGQIETLNAIVHQMAPVWEGSAWSEPQPVRHPAWIYARALMGPMLSAPVAAARLQLEDLRAWADEEPHWTCDMVIDQPSQVGEVLDLICATGRTRRTLRDLRYSVIRDGAVGPVIQQFTPRNSWDFSGEITFPKEIHGFRVRCISERLEWQQDEVVAYADGYDATNATEFETLELRGVVLSKNQADGGNAWRLGRYHLAQAILRPEAFEWKCDIDHLRVNMGDKVRLVHDVPLIGVGSGRVQAITTHDNGDLASIALDEFIAPEGSSFRVCIRCVSGAEHVFSAVPPTSYAGVWTVQGAISSSDIHTGDLVSIEEMTQESTEILVTSIRHDGELRATLRGVPAAPAVLQADQGEIPPYAPVITNVIPRENLAPESPNIISADVEARLSPVGIYGVVEWSPWDQFGVDYWNVYATPPSGRRSFHSRVTEPTVPIILTSNGVWVIDVVAVGSGGSSLSATVDLERTAEIGRPTDVTGFRIDVAGSQAQLTWDAGGALVSHYEIRYLPDASASTDGWNEAQVVAARMQGSNWSISSQTGRYLIKAVSVFGELSQNPSVVDTELFVPTAPTIASVSVRARFDPARVTSLVTWNGDAGLTYLVDVIAPNGQRSRVGETDLKSFEFNTPAVGSYAVEIIARGNGGFLSVPARQEFQRGVGVEVPPAMTGFRVDVTGAQAQLTWDAGGAIVDHYHIKHVPEGMAQDWPQALDVLTEAVGRTATVPALQGSYLIRAVSVFGRNSPTSSVVSTNTQFLDDYNVVEAVNDAPAFAGEKTSGLMLVAGGLETVSQTQLSDWGHLSSIGPLLREGGVATDATYTFSAPVDLGAVYTSRVTAQVDALGFAVSNKLSAWPNLSQVQSLLGAASESWACELQVRTTIDDPANVEGWSDWSVFRVGDYVARAFEFRCAFRSDDPNVVVRLTSAAVQIDMPDRVASGSDIICPPAGIYVPFTPPFRVKPAINVTGQELPSGARGVRSNVSAAGFHQQFVDASGAGVDCSFDWLAKGYGRVQS